LSQNPYSPIAIALNSSRSIALHQDNPRHRAESQRAFQPPG
jgi:hypothetical protein